MTTLILYVYNMLKGQPMFALKYYIFFQCENIVSPFVSVRRLAMPDTDEQNKSHTFFYNYLLYDG